MTRILDTKRAGTVFLAITTCLPTYAAASSAPQVIVQSRASTGLGQFGDAADGLGAMLAYGNLRAKVEKWKALPDGWDGEGGVPLSSSTCEAATSFLSKSQIAGLRAPRAFIAGDGEVGFSWETEIGLASVAFLPDGHVVGKVPTGGAGAFRIDEPYSDIADVDGLLTALATALSA